MIKGGVPAFLRSSILSIFLTAGFLGNACPPSTVYYYFSQWVKTGVFKKLWQEAQSVD